jgi:hypothetical protein
MMRPGQDQSIPFGSSAASQPEGRKNIAHRSFPTVGNAHQVIPSPARDERNGFSNRQANQSILSSLTGLWPKGAAVPGDKSPGYYQSSLRDGKISEMERWPPARRVSGKRISRRIGDRPSGGSVTDTPVVFVFFAFLRGHPNCRF